ncbi:MAG: hypothetical protein ABI907_12830, partial [Ramlibacter sp.]
MKRLLATLLAFAPFATAWGADWPSNPKLHGDAFLPPGLLKLQADPVANPVTLWLENGAALWVDRSTGP